MVREGRYETRRSSERNLFNPGIHYCPLTGHNWHEETKQHYDGSDSRGFDDFLLSLHRKPDAETTEWGKHSSGELVTWQSWYLGQWRCLALCILGTVLVLLAGKV